MTAATIKLIEAVERLNMTGEIGDGMVANLHELAGLARLEVMASVAIPPILDLETRSPGLLEKLRNYPLKPVLTADIQNQPAPEDWSRVNRFLGLACRHVFHKSPHTANWQTCPSCGKP